MPTILDVARKAGVAAGTASEIINSGNIHKFARGTVAKVRQAAVDIGYQVNRSAQALRTQRTKMIGIAIYSDTTLGAFTQPYVASVYQGIGDYFASLEYKLIFENYSAERDFVHLTELSQSGTVDGIIFVMLAPQVKMLVQDETAFLRNLTVPHVVIHSLNRTFSHPGVGFNTGACVRIAMEHFARVHGYTSVGFVGSGNNDTHIGELAQAFAAEAAGYGMATRPEWMLPGGYGTGRGIRIVRDVLAAGTELPRALFVADASTADGMIHAFRNGGVRVPEDIAIIGFGDMVDDFYHIKQLTSATQPAKKKGAVAAEMLVQLLDGKQDVPSVILEPFLEVRTSCGCGGTAV